MNIDWEELPQKELVALLRAARAEKDRRIEEMREASGEAEQPAPKERKPYTRQQNGAAITTD